MNISIIALDEPTSLFAGVFTQNAFPGAPVKIGRARLMEESLGAIVVNNKVSNVCAAGGGVDDAEVLYGEVARLLGFCSRQVIPSSTGVIGWRLPVSFVFGVECCAVC